MIDRNDLERLKRLLAPGGQRIAVVAHTNPDGDAIGSALAWRRLLAGMGHEVCCAVPNRYPAFLGWMTDIGHLRIFREDTDGEVARFIAEADLIFCLDFNQIERLEGMSAAIAANTRARRVLIDHHLNPPAIYDLQFSVPAASSTSFLVYGLIVALAGEKAVDYATAESLYVGMMTDTGNFSFSNLTPELYRAVAVLAERGIDIPAIHNNVYNSFSEGRIRLLGYALNRKMEIMHPYGAAYISLTERDLRRFRFQIGDSEGFVNFPLAIREVSMSAMFLETKNFIRVSLRSRGDVDVNVFARRYFDGGGHRNAAGGKSFLPMPETVERFRAAVEEFFGERSGAE
ncbi:bifunctional oligoribonuclease/PAP phosphatase NrnA [Rikenellaceae bacterium DSM 108975]|nr:bifunctional oligoribonuclease/PAP phosphatase NrnA [Gallalistipes aquisgranensis]MBE5034101.1 bifunctional oligoribonuclease/PAP phosphatase NrnA [Gallalistipes aquisgranensis]